MNLATRAIRTLPASLRTDIKQHAKSYLRRTCRDSVPAHVEAIRSLCFLALRTF